MIVTNDFRHLPNGNRVFVLGNFDGVHLGHQTLFREATRLAENCQGEAIAFAFYPHPLQVLGCTLDAITPDHEKIRLISEQGLSAYFAMPFNRGLADMSPAKFVEEILLKRAKAREVVVGFNFSFGKGGAGTPEFLHKALAVRGVPVIISPPVLVDGEAVSSTRIRQQIRLGDLERVATMLGRPYGITGTVEHGDRRGRTLGFPTANLYGLQGLALPPYGVYAAFVHGIGYGMANLGQRPSFPQAGPSLEVHILDWHGNLYGRQINVQLLEFIRGEQRFTNLDDLQNQLARDRAEIIHRLPTLASR